MAEVKFTVLQQSYVLGLLSMFVNITKNPSIMHICDV